MIILELYKITNQVNELTKTLENPVVLNGNFRSEFDSIDVVVEVESSSLDFNYVYIQQLNKYYFIKDITHVNSKITRLFLHCDVLMTYKDDILASYALVVQGGNINPYYSNVDSESRQLTRRINFPYTFNNNGNYILVTACNDDVFWR